MRSASGGSTEHECGGPGSQSRPSASASAGAIGGQAADQRAPARQPRRGPGRRPMRRQRHGHGSAAKRVQSGPPITDDRREVRPCPRRSRARTGSAAARARTGRGEASRAASRTRERALEPANRHASPRGDAAGGEGVDEDERAPVSSTSTSIVWRRPSPRTGSCGRAPTRRSRAAPTSSRTVCTAGSPAVRYTRVADGVVSRRGRRARLHVDREPVAADDAAGRIQDRDDARPGSSSATRRQHLQRQRVAAAGDDGRAAPRRSKRSRSAPSRPTRRAARSRRRSASSSWRIQSTIASTPSPVLRFVKTNGRVAAHAARVALHHGEVGAHVGRQVDLVDDEQIGARDARARPCAGSSRPRRRRSRRSSRRPARG